MESITANSSRYWIMNHPLKMERYIRRYHKREDREVVERLIFWDFPDEGKKLIENFDLTNDQKITLFLDWIIKQPAITLAGFGDQRMGKDVTLCVLFEKAIKRCEELKIQAPRIVTLGNIKNPPFVKEEDMYFSFLNIPSGSKDREVWIYCSEIETVIPAREGKSAENKLFSQLAGTLAQNHQKLFGLCKLASRVDINFLRDCNAKFFKYINEEKLKVDGIERDNVLSGLGRWLLPKKKSNQDIDKSGVLFAFDNHLLTCKVNMPYWYGMEYSEMFREIPMDKINEYIITQFENGMKIEGIRQAVAQKFRKKLRIDFLINLLSDRIELSKKYKV